MNAVIVIIKESINATAKEPIKLNPDLLFRLFFTIIDHAHRPRHRFKMPPEPKNFRDI